MFSIYWLKKRIILPLNVIGEAAQVFERLCRSEKDPSKIVLTIPEINSGDEIEGFAKTLSRMSRTVKKYVDDLIESSAKMNKLERNLDETQQKTHQLAQLATRNALTGIRNKTAYEEEVKRVIADLESGNKRIGVAMIDLNYLKRINDTFGHEKGNVAIIKLCRLVCSVFAHSPVFRIGGDEFVVILRNSDYDKVEALVAQLYVELEKRAETEGLADWERTSAAIGYALFDDKIDASYDCVFRRADEAMYERKKQMKAGRE